MICRFEIACLIAMAVLFGAIGARFAGAPSFCSTEAPGSIAATLNCR